MSLEKNDSPRHFETMTESDRLDALDQLQIFPQMMQEGILFAGSGSAILLQAAMPGLTRQDGEHDKNLATELGTALQALLSYTSCLVFGTRQEKKNLLDLLQSDQPPLKGTEYYAEFPETRLWIAATLYATATDFYQRIYGRVNYHTAQRAYDEFTLLMYCLGLPPGTWPEDRTAFWTYWDDQLEKLHVGSQAHEVAKDLLEDRDVPRWVQRMKPLLRVITIEMLPPRIREAYGLKSTVGTRGVYRTTMGLSVAAYPALPTSWRSYPCRYYLKELRKEMNVV